jgi:hypothetical protein
MFPNVLSMRQHVCLTIPQDLVRWLDVHAQERQLPRSYAAQEIFERARDQHESRADDEGAVRSTR